MRLVEEIHRPSVSVGRRNSEGEKSPNRPSAEPRRFAFGAWAPNNHESARMWNVS